MFWDKVRVDTQFIKHIFIGVSAHAFVLDETLQLRYIAQ